jgi:microsomal dipeptidase-like Zn-dependent dipeptidase
VVQKHGAHRVGIGSEFCAFEGINQTVKDVSELGELAEVFSQRGYSDEAIAGILGDNWRRFYASLLDRSSN